MDYMNLENTRNPRNTRYARNVQDRPIYENISYDPESTLRHRHLSRQNSQQVDPAFCQQNITQIELDRYIREERPKTIITIYSAGHVNPHSIIISIYHYLPTRTTAEYINTGYGDTSKEIPDFKYYVTIVPEMIAYDSPRLPDEDIYSEHRNYPNIINLRGEVDLLSMYRILQRRLVCSEVNLHFAKQVVIKRFNDIVNGYLNHPSQTRILDLYLYLMAHAMVFDLGINPLSSFDIDIDMFGNPAIDPDDPEYIGPLSSDPNYIDQPLNDPQTMSTINQVRLEVNRLISVIREQLNRL